LSRNTQSRLQQLTSAGVCLLPVVMAYSVVARVALRYVPVPRLLDIVARSRPLCFFRGWLGPASLLTAADIAAWVSRGSGRCLLRSVLLYWLLGSPRKSVAFLIGVRQTALVLESHAWIESDGRVLGDRPGIGSDFSVVYRAAHS
jgi:hypothetical protein